jgi:SAM-dependent methyltransferase
MPYDLIRRDSINELCGQRDAALKMFGEMWDQYDAVCKAVRRAAPSGHFTIPEEYRGSPWVRIPDRDKFLNGMRVSVDRAVWPHLMSVGQFETLMGHTERQKLRNDLWNEDPPEATPENCWVTFERLMADSGAIFRSGVAVAFANLDRRFRSHDGFKIGSRIVLTYFASDGRVNYSGRAEETMRDVERTFRTLDGERMEGIVGKANSAMGYRNPTCNVEDDYFRLKVFKNGNAHLWFKRDDLVERVNKLLAEHYGAVLGHSETRAPEHENRPGYAKHFGFFATPESVATTVAEKAGLYRRTEQEPLRILEPSAGTGALIAAARGAHTALQPHIRAVEIERDRARGLAVLGIADRVISGDFLELSPEQVGTFDRILMNPPFDGGRDIDHVRHAVKFLRPGGRLVAVMSAGTEFRDDARTVAFRELAKRMKPRDSYHGSQWSDLPAGSFKEAGAMVNTVTFTLEAPK